MLQIGWRVVFLLALPVFVISGKDGLELDENTENSLHREDGLDMEMCSNGDKGGKPAWFWLEPCLRQREGREVPWNQRKGEGSDKKIKKAAKPRSRSLRR